MDDKDEDEDEDDKDKEVPLHHKRVSSTHPNSIKLGQCCVWMKFKPKMSQKHLMGKILSSFDAE